MQLCRWIKTEMLWKRKVLSRSSPETAEIFRARSASREKNKCKISSFKSHETLYKTYSTQVLANQGRLSDLIDKPCLGMVTTKTSELCTGTSYSRERFGNQLIGR